MNENLERLSVECVLISEPTDRLRKNISHLFCFNWVEIDYYKSHRLNGNNSDFMQNYYANDDEQRKEFRHRQQLMEYFWQTNFKRKNAAVLAVRAALTILTLKARAVATAPALTTARVLSFRMVNAVRTAKTTAIFQWRIRTK